MVARNIISRLGLGITMLAGSLLACPIAVAQTLPDSLIAQVRAGAARSMLLADSTVLPLVGSLLVPTVAVRLNGRGPFRFLIDLGSNVVAVRNAVAAAARGGGPGRPGA